MRNDAWTQVETQMTQIRSKGNSLLGMVACWIRNDSVATDRDAKEMMLGRIDQMRSRLDEAERIVKALD